jgi:hypothetical protein
VCDGFDNDCDGAVDEALDGDGDGYTTCDDCDDSDPSAFPGAVEICSGPELDCDGVPPDPCLNCTEVLGVDPFRVDGIYTIDPDGSGALGAIDVWCDLSTDGGGWTRILRTDGDVATSVAMMTTWSAIYSISIADPAGGALRRVAAQHWNALSLLGDFMVRHELATVSGGSCTPLYYALFAGGLSVGDPSSSGPTIYAWTGPNYNHVLNGNSPGTFSSMDYGPDQSCVNGGRVPWFYKQGCGHNMPTAPYYGSGLNQPAVTSLALGSDINGNDPSAACASSSIASPPNAPTHASYTWYAETSQEYYLR